MVKALLFVYQSKKYENYNYKSILQYTYNYKYLILIRVYT